MKLYTEEQLFYICQAVAEKMCASSLPTEVIINRCRDYGHSKVEIDIETIKHLMDNDDIGVINVALTTVEPYNYEH